MVIIDEVSTLQRGPFANSGPHPAILLFDFPIIGPKKKVVVNPIYGYQNLSGEKYKCNEKRISSMGHTSEEKNPKNPIMGKSKSNMAGWGPEFANGPL